MTVDIDNLHSVSISIDEDRKKLQKHIFEKSNLCVPVYFDGSKILGLGTHFNCSIAHSGAIKMAKCLDWDAVVIYEDDAYPCIDCHEKMKHFLSNVPDDCGILVLGWNVNKKSKNWEEHRIIKG